MNILCVDCGLGPAFAALGHRVRSVAPGPGVVDARRLTADFDPDLLFQQEELGDRTFLDHLDELPCVRAFWALDAHLNIHWHKYYTRLFDVTFTPHPSLFRHVPPEWTPDVLHPLAMHGHALPWRPHAERSRPLAFVGRNDASRPLRSRFLRLLAPYGLRPDSGLSGRDMLTLYADARVVPNESIGFEVNYRVTEAASAGACVLTPDIGEDLERLYLPDREILTYAHGLELVEKLEFLDRRPDLAEKLGRAAWEATNARHLAVHRAQAILDALPERRTATAGAALPMALAQRGRHIRKPVPPALLARLKKAGSPEAAALGLRCLSEGYPGEAADQTLREFLIAPPATDQADMDLAAMGHALLRGDLPLFRAFWGRLHQPFPDRRPERPASLYHAGLLLAAELQRRGRLFQPGFAWDPTVHTPETAMEALLCAERHAGGDREWARRLERLSARSRTLTLVRGETLSLLNSHGSDWRTRLEYGCALLDACDVEEGLRQIGKALDEAEQAGRAALARDILKARRLGSPEKALRFRPPRTAPDSPGR